MSSSTRTPLKVLTYCGVPQGSYSGLGPILFIMYLGDSTSLRTTYLVSICMQMISGEEKLSCTIFSLVLYSARIMLGAEGAYSFPYIRAGNVKLQHFLSRTLFDTHHVKGKERTVFLHQVRKVTAFPPALVLYSARCVSGVKSVQFCLHQGRKS